MFYNYIGTMLINEASFYTIFVYLYNVYIEYGLKMKPHFHLHCDIGRISYDTCSRNNDTLLTGFLRSRKMLGHDSE